jgi:NTE family protein
MPTRAEWLAAEPFTLALGAGFFGFFAHTGLLAALEEAGLRPARVVGVSAGALAGGLWASGLSAADLEAELCALRRDDFWDPGLPLFGLLRGRKFGAILGRVLARSGVRRVEDCPLPFAAVVHDVVRRAAVPLERGPLDLAIRASCTVPLMFRPIVEQGRVLVDGGVSDRGGFTALGDARRVLLHWLPSRRRVRLSAAEPVPPSLPGRQSLVLVTPGLPKVGPFALARGPVALAVTRAHVQAWLAEPVGRQPTGLVDGVLSPSQPQPKLSRKT